MKYFSLTHYGEHDGQPAMLVTFENNLDAFSMQTAISLVRGFPNRYYEYNSRSWLITNSPQNLNYMANYIKPEFYSLDAPAVPFFEKLSSIVPSNEMWNFVFSKAEVSIPFSPQLESYRHQTLGLKYLHQAEFFALLWDMGTGKTKVLIDEIAWQCEERKKDAISKNETPRPLNVLVISPNTIQINWLEELETFLPEDFTYYATVLQTGPKAIKQLSGGLHHKNIDARIYMCGVDRVRSNIESLKKMNFDICILDEAHRIKATGAHRTKAILELSKTCKRRFILTGTPVANSLSDLFALYEFLKPGILGCETKYSFDARYSHISAKKGLSQLATHPALSQLREKIATCSLIVKKSECLDLPEKTRAIVKVKLTPQQKTVYDKMLTFLFAEIETAGGEEFITEAPAMIVQLLRLSQICNGFIRNSEGGEMSIPGEKPKLDAVQELIEDLPENEKVIIWARFTHDIRDLEKRLDKMHISHATINGAVKNDERHIIKNAFNSNIGPRVLIAEPGCGGEGLTILGTEERPCKLVIRYSSDFSIIKREQSEDRCHRIGMFCAPHYVDILAANTVDEFIHSALMDKLDLAKAFKDVSGLRKWLHADDVIIDDDDSSYDEILEG